MHHLFLFIAFFLLGAGLSAQPLPRAHAHNDYEHERPLFDALAQGFTSVEADIHLIEGELYVAHDRPSQLDSSRTLRRLYLEPLRKRIQEQEGRVYPGYEQPFFLMIDIKTAGEATYQVLSAQLQDYRVLLSTPGGVKGPLLIFLSGNRPLDGWKADPDPLVALDGRPEDLGKGFTPAQMPVVSDSFWKHLRWNGEGKMPDAQRRKLQELVARVHAEGKKLRLWGCPDKKDLWRAFFEAGVDLINTDRLEELRAAMVEWK